MHSCGKRTSNAAIGLMGQAILGVVTAVAVFGPTSVLADEDQEAQGDGPGPTTAGDVDPMDEPLITDRPDFTESTDAVPAGHVQIEAGYTFTYDRDGSDRVRDHTAPELLLRIGVVEDFEIRIGWDGYSWSDNRSEEKRGGGRRVTVDDWTQGANDISLGFKYKFFDQDGSVPHFGVIGEISVPSGSGDVSSSDVDPAIILLWAYDLTDVFSIAGNVGFAYPNDIETGRSFQTSASLAGALALTDRLGTYIEYYGFYPNTEDEDAAHYINGGFTYLINNNFQIDWRIGAGLNNEADDFFTGVGVAVRF